MCLKEAKLNLSVNAHALTFGRIQVLVATRGVTISIEYWLRIRDRDLGIWTSVLGFYPGFKLMEDTIAHNEYVSKLYKDLTQI